MPVCKFCNKVFKKTSIGRSSEKICVSCWKKKLAYGKKKKPKS